MPSDSPEMRPALLRIEGLGLSFGGLRALHHVSLTIAEGEIVAIIGPNGAGKTSLLNIISGFYRAQAGDVWLGSQRITRLPPERIARLGIARTFQHCGMFDGLSAVENLLAGRNIHIKSGILAQALYFGKARREELQHRQAVERIIDFLEMEAVRDKVVGTLPYGLRKRVELGRAMAMEPKIILLDEPMAGMNSEEKEDMARFILDVREEMGVTVAIIEHDMGVVMDISDRVVVLDFGEKIAEGRPEEVAANPAVIRAYLGTGGAWHAAATPEGAR